MGSGGLRGLQILRSGVQSARGGFDSHAFPPIFAVVLMVLVAAFLLPGIAGAQGVKEPVRDPQATPRATRSQADSVIVDSALVLPKSQVLQIADPNSPAARRARRDSVRVARMGVLDEPRWVMLRSLVVPGWGQLHNRAWLKAALVAGGEAWFVSDIFADNRKLKDLDAELAAADRAGDFDARNVAVERYNARLDHMVGREWLLGGLLVYSLIDAYVDAHFVNFRFEFDHDSARPNGVRLGLEKHF
jgi:hypothetical protein